MSRKPTIKELQEYIELLESDLEKEKREREADAKDYEKIVQDYEQQTNELKQDLLNARGKIISHEITLASYKEKVGRPLLSEGEERDLYEGEQKDYLLALVRATMRTLDKSSRGFRICESILSANKEIGERQRLIEQVTSIMRKATRLDGSETLDLNALGIDTTKTNGGHVKLTLKGDSRYCVTISGSPSDKSRNGLNSLSDINRIFFG